MQKNSEGARIARLQGRTGEIDQPKHLDLVGKPKTEITDQMFKIWNSKHEHHRDSLSLMGSPYWQQGKTHRLPPQRIVNFESVDRVMEEEHFINDISSKKLKQSASNQRVTNRPSKSELFDEWAYQKLLLIYNSAFPAVDQRNQSKAE